MPFSLPHQPHSWKEHFLTHYALVQTLECKPTYSKNYSMCLPGWWASVPQCVHEFTTLSVITFHFLSPRGFCWLDHPLISHSLMSARAHDLTIVNNKSFAIACPRLSASDSSVKKFPFQNNKAGCTKHRIMSESFWATTVLVTTDHTPETSIHPSLIITRELYQRQDLLLAKKPKTQPTKTNQTNKTNHNLHTQKSKVLSSKQCFYNLHFEECKQTQVKLRQVIQRISTVTAQSPRWSGSLPQINLNPVLHSQWAL